MGEIKKEIEMAFSLISSIPVTQDAVELMAAAKEHLRKAYKLTNQRKEVQNG